MSGAVVIGVVDEVDGRPIVRAVADPPAATPEILALARGADLADVFRFASPCVESRCRHFTGDVCRLAAKIATMVDETVDQLPSCSIRADCRWFRQEGVDACMRCPLILTSTSNPSEAMRLAADPTR